MVMEFWFSQGNEKFQLPVPPADFMENTAQKVETVDVIGYGEMTLIGEENADEITIKSFFPVKYYPFCQYKNLKKPYECVSLFKKWKESKKPVRLLITTTNINKLYLIEQFNYGERAGSRDVEFELSLKEYRMPGYKETTEKTKSVARQNQKPRKPSLKTKSATYTIKSGDTLWVLARKFYGDGSRWPELAKKNGIKDPRKLRVGQVLVL
jgi:nucleoid-associated protein YgaU